MDELNERVRADIDAHGWHVAKIAGDDFAPAWAFTIGLQERFQHPEVICFGLDLEVLHALLNRVGSLVGGGRSFGPGREPLVAPAREAEVLQGTDCAFRQVATRWRDLFAGNAGWFYQERSFELIQCFWPDPEGRLPWDEGFEADLLLRQPQLYLPEEAQALSPGFASVLREEGAL